MCVNPEPWGYWTGQGPCAQLICAVGGTGAFATTEEHSQLEGKGLVCFSWSRILSCVCTTTPLPFLLRGTFSVGAPWSCPSCYFPQALRPPSTASSLKPKFQVTSPTRPHQSKPVQPRFGALHSRSHDIAEEETRRRRDCQHALLKAGALRSHVIPYGSRVTHRNFLRHPPRRR